MNVSATARAIVCRNRRPFSAQPFFGLSVYPSMLVPESMTLMTPRGLKSSRVRVTAFRAGRRFS